MGKQSLYSDHLTNSESLDRINSTHLGQAHFAGTGPEGTTCRGCEKFQRHTAAGKTTPHKYLGEGRGTLYLQKARCTHPILNKADRLIPHDCQSCYFFKENSSPPPHFTARRSHQSGAI